MVETHREKLSTLFDRDDDGVIYIKGASVASRYGTDYEFPFRQESNFLYLTGVNEPDFHLLIEPASNIYYLFVPKRDTQYAVWNGYVRPLDEYKEMYNPDYIRYDTDIEEVLKQLKPDKVYCLNIEQAADINKLGYKTNIETLPDALVDCRVIKSEWELEQMRYAGKITSLAHREVMKAIQPDMYEYQLKAVFDYTHLKNGLMQEAYTGIYGGGKNSAILHYVENNDRMKDGDLFLIDAGYEYNGYAHDVTRTYPANGKFTELQAGVYDAVLKAHKECIEASKPGMQMEELHMMAAKIMMQELLDIGLIKGNLDEIMDKNIFALFFPHGLGHFLGLDTHDVGGYPKGVDHIDRPGIKYLRVRRKLEPGMVITIEPGLYMVPALLEPALNNADQARYLNGDLLKTMYEFGGVRIEDNIVITEDGYEDLTDVPKERDEIEALIGSKQPDLS
ncbi:MAG TPA: aminopeptidase P family protein [Balneolales bacterium]|nr:aminopeptidase P family protein [Balneolales bacterium]